MYSETTHSIRVSVEPVYLDDQSSPTDDHYVWAYHIEIENNGDRIIQLLKRHWMITDANGLTQQVRGAGVVGEQPILAPGERFEYSSGTPLATPSGIMIGRYEMATRGGDHDGERFDVRVPAFSLDSPHNTTQVH